MDAMDMGETLRKAEVSQILKLEPRDYGDRRCPISSVSQTLVVIDLIRRSLP